MAGKPDLGRDFGRLWLAYATSTAGSWFALDAFPLIAVLVLHSSPAQVSVLAAAGLAVGAVLAVPLGPWVEFRRKRPVMQAMDAVRLLALLSLVLAHALGALGFAQLLTVSMVVAVANIVFTAASGACLKALVPQEHLVAANARFEATLWTATALGPPLGGAAVGVFGPLTTTLANAVSYLLSMLGVRAIRAPEPAPAARPALRFAELVAGWRHLLGHPRLRPLFLNTVLVNGLIMAVAPLLAVLLLRELGLPPWQYGLAFGVPCLGGLLGSRLARPLTARFGRTRVLRVSGTLRVLWPVALAAVPAGPAALPTVMVIEFGLILCIGVYNPLVATQRLAYTPDDRVARTLAAWSVSSSGTIAALTACWGLLATGIGTRPAIAAAGLLMLATPVLLRRIRAEEPPATDAPAGAERAGSRAPADAPDRPAVDDPDRTPAD